MFKMKPCLKWSQCLKWSLFKWIQESSSNIHFNRPLLLLVGFFLEKKLLISLYEIEFLRRWLARVKVITLSTRLDALIQGFMKELFWTTTPLRQKELASKVWGKTLLCQQLMVNNCKFDRILQKGPISKKKKVLSARGIPNRSPM